MGMPGVCILHALKASADAVAYQKMGSRTEMAVNRAIKALIILNRKSDPHDSASCSMTFTILPSFTPRHPSPKKESRLLLQETQKKKNLFFAEERKEGSQAISKAIAQK